MTRTEVNSIPFKFASHLSMEHEHCTTYTAQHGGHSFGMCKHVPYRDGEPRGRAYVHFMVDGKVFKTKEKFYQFCETL